MEPVEIARQALLVLSPLIAQGALARLGGATTDRVMQLVGQTWNLLQRGAQGNPKAENALEVYQEEPDDERNLQRLAQHLADYLRQHHQAVDELQALVGQLQQQAQSAGFTNSGTNYGQQVGVNQGTMTQNNQTINNQAANQGMQGTFHGPVTFGRDREL